MADFRIAPYVPFLEPRFHSGQIRSVQELGLGWGPFPTFLLKNFLFLGQMEKRDAGRVMLSRHFVGPTPFTVASIYGFPAGPTWPRNRSLTEQLLTTVTKEVVLGTSGCRIIQGDFNQPADGLDAFQIWRHYGWVEAQCLAKDLWGRHIEATCKNASTVDLMWLSPEAAMLCVQVGTMDVFADHLTVYAHDNHPLAFAFHH